MNDTLTHLNTAGEAHMVDIAGKPVTVRTATARGMVRMQPGTLTAVTADRLPKGDVFATARIAGIQAAKKTAELIPLCHPLALTSVEVDLEPDPDLPGIRIQARCRTTGRTGVEMEALTAVTAAGLTLYDMCKGIDRTMVIGEIQVAGKTGGQSRDWPEKSTGNPGPLND